MFSRFVQNLGELAFTFALGPGKLNFQFVFDYEYPQIIICFVIYFFKTTTKIYSTFIYDYDLEISWSSNSVGWIHFESNSYFIQYNMLTRKTVHLMSIIQVLRITSPKKFGSLQHMDNIGVLQHNPFRDMTQHASTII